MTTIQFDAFFNNGIVIADHVDFIATYSTHIGV